MKILRRVLLVIAILAVLAASAITAYQMSSDTPSAPTPMPGTTQTATAANPVSILRQMHVPTSDVVGRVDIDGDRYASGQFASGEQVTVTTYASQQAEDVAVARNPSNDVNKLLVGYLFTVTVTGVDGARGISFPAPVAALAQASGAVAE